MFDRNQEQMDAWVKVQTRILVDDYKEWAEKQDEETQKEKVLDVATAKMPEELREPILAGMQEVVKFNIEEYLNA